MATQTCTLCVVAATQNGKLTKFRSFNTIDPYIVPRLARPTYSWGEEGHSFAASFLKTAKDGHTQFADDVRYHHPLGSGEWYNFAIVGVIASHIL